MAWLVLQSSNGMNYILFLPFLLCFKEIYYKNIYLDVILDIHYYVVLN